MISDLQARTIASEWHGGQGSALYALASTGAINTARADHDIETEIVDCMPSNDTPNKQELDNLWDYVKANGPRGPQDGWQQPVHRMLDRLDYLNEHGLENDPEAIHLRDQLTAATRRAFMNTIAPDFQRPDGTYPDWITKETTVVGPPWTEKPQ